MAEYPNQKTVIIDKKQSTINFASYGIPELLNACKVLKGSGFKVYVSIFSNVDGYEKGLSPEYMKRYWGIKKSTYYDGLAELEEKGFLEPIIPGKKYIAHQVSMFDESDIRKTERKSEKQKEGTETGIEETKIGIEDSENNQSNNKKRNTKNNKNNKDRDINIAVVKPIESEFIF